MIETRSEIPQLHQQRIVRFVLSENLTAGGDASAFLRICKSDGTFLTTTVEIDVYDTDGDLDGSTGAKGKAVFMPDSGHYEILSLVC